jgi:hypothetical protein
MHILPATILELRAGPKSSDRNLVRGNDTFYNSKPTHPEPRDYRVSAAARLEATE